MCVNVYGVLCINVIGNSYTWKSEDQPLFTSQWNRKIKCEEKQKINMVISL